MNFQMSDRFKKNGARLSKTVFICNTCRNLERHFGRVNGMIRTVNQYSFKSYNRVACKNTLNDRFLKSLFNCGEIVLGNCTADNLFFKNKLVTVMMAEFNPHITELTVTAGLFLVSALNLDTLTDSFTVCNLGCLKCNGYAEL